MNTLSFEDVIELIREQKTPYIRITDLAKKRVYDFVDQDDYEVTIRTLTQKRNMLAAYSCLYFTAANDTVKKSNWQNPFTWCVRFDSNALTVLNQGEQGLSQHRGFVSEKEANLISELNGLKLKVEFQKQIDDLTVKGSGDIFSQIQKLFPLAAFFIKDAAKLDAFTKIAGAMAGNNMTPAAGLAGQQGATVESHKTPAEVNDYVNDIQKNITELGNKVGIEKLHKLVIGINNKPHLVDAALTFI